MGASATSAVCSIETTVILLAHDSIWLPCTWISTFFYQWIPLLWAPLQPRPSGVRLQQQWCFTAWMCFLYWSQVSVAAGMMTAALPLSPSVVIMPSGLQLEVTVPVTDDTFNALWKLTFYWVYLWPADLCALMTCSNSPRHFWQLEPACVKALIQNCYTSNTLLSTKSTLFIPGKNH